MNSLLVLSKIWLRAQQINFVKNGGPLSLTLAVTYQCQSRCQICSIWKIYQKDKKLLKNELKSHDYQKIFQQFGNKIFHLTITGGEPFLKKDFLEIIKSAVAYLPNLTWISITTNGQSEIIERQIIKIRRTFKGIISIEISLDGVSKIHDKIRGVSGSFDKALQTFKILESLSQKDKNLLINFSYTFSKNNAGQLSELFNNSSIGTDDVNYSFVQNGLLFHNTRKNLDSTFVNKIIKDINFISSKEFRKFNFKRVFKNYYLQNLQNYLKTKERNSCDAGKFSLFVDPYGNYYPCITWAKKLENWIEEKSLNKQNCPKCLTPCEIQFTSLSEFPFNFLKRFFVDSPLGHKK